MNDDETSLETLTDPPLDHVSPPLAPKSWTPRLPRYVIIIVVVIVGLVLTVVIIALLKHPSKKIAPTVVTINTQNLDNGTLNKLTAQAGPNKTVQQLTISPDTLFKNSTEVQGSLKADKQLDVSGNVNVAGTTTLQGAVGINSNLAVRGALSVGGALSAASLNVGSLAVTTVNASGSLNFGGHLVPSGTTPAVAPSSGTSGGTVTVSGNDTAGTITITIGNGPLVAGEMAILNFHTQFSTTPKVQLTPISGDASALNYYATRSATFFTVETTTTPTHGASYVFDYLVTQ
ncbi:MAG: hypothetical protein ABI602_00295 [Candidatus Saccharibacteria bacterium]